MGVEIVLGLTEGDHMETLTKTPERMSESFAQPDMQERFGAWAERAEKEARQEKKEEKSGPREISLKGRSEEERRFIEAVAEKDGPAKESRRESAAEKDAAKPAEQDPNATESGKPDGEKPASESTEPAPEPIAADRYWQGKIQSKEDHESHWRQVDARAGVVLQFINSHPQKEQIVEGMKAFFAGKPKAWQDAISPDLYTALAEVASPGEVMRHIALQAEDRETLRKAKNSQELRAHIRTIAKLYPGSASKASPKPRAPKPASEVGGRGSLSDEGTRGEMDFSSFSTKQSQRYADGR
jgi:hypothetical protein